MNGLPWSIDEAGAQLRKASRFQQEAEDQLKRAHRDAASAEDAYRIQLAKVITSLREMGIPATVCLDLAKGAEDVATLRRERDVAVGLREAAQQACWRRAADRRDCQALCGWSERREFAEGRGEVTHQFDRPIGAGA